MRFDFTDIRGGTEREKEKGREIKGNRGEGRERGRETERERCLIAYFPFWSSLLLLCCLPLWVLGDGREYTGDAK